MTMMRARDRMTRDVQACRPDQNLADAARMMWDHDCGCVPVVDSDRRVIGMLTDRDVAMAALHESTPLHAITVGQAMSRNIVRCAPDDALELVLVHMGRARVRRLPVVDANGRLVGILSLHDIARGVENSRSWFRGLGHRDIGRAFAEISEPRKKPSPAKARERATLAV